jgi:hypothetical protein
MTGRVNNATTKESNSFFINYKIRFSEPTKIIFLSEVGGNF